MKIGKKLTTGIISLGMLTAFSSFAVESYTTVASASYVTPNAYRGKWKGRLGTRLYVTANGVYVSFQAGKLGSFGSYGSSSSGGWHGIYPKSGGQGAAIKFSNGKAILSIAGQSIVCHR